MGTQSDETPCGKGTSSHYWTLPQGAGKSQGFLPLGDSPFALGGPQDLWETPCNLLPGGSPKNSPLPLGEGKG